MSVYCDFSSTDLKCPACGYVARKRNTYRECRPIKEKGWQPFQLGDAVEKALTAVGVTKDRVEALTRTAGKPGGCGCAGRKKWLNEVGAKVQTAARESLIGFRNTYLGR